MKGQVPPLQVWKCCCHFPLAIIFVCRDECEDNQLDLNTSQKEKGHRHWPILSHTLEPPLFRPPSSPPCVCVCVCVYDRRHLFGFASKSVPVESMGFSVLSVAGLFTYDSRRRQFFRFFILW
jgi:hypothetical protein